MLSQKILKSDSTDKLKVRGDPQWVLELKSKLLTNDVRVLIIYHVTYSRQFPSLELNSLSKTFFHSTFDHSQFTSVTKISSSGALSQLAYHQMIVYLSFLNPFFIPLCCTIFRAAPDTPSCSSRRCCIGSGQG